MSDTNHRPTPDIMDQAAGALRDTSVPDGPPAELAAATLAAINNRFAGAVPGEQVRRERRRRIMRYVSFSTAAAVILGTAGVLWFGGNRAIALYDVIQKVKEAESVTFVETQQLGDQKPMELTYSIRGQQAHIEGMGTVVILDTKAKKGLMLIPQFKVYEKLGEGGRGTVAGPPGKQTPVEALLALKDRKPESTVAEKLDGKTVQKITIKGDPKADPPGDWVIWVDPKTELPVKMVNTNTTIAGDREVLVVHTYEKFVWNPKLPDKLFDMTVPEGYTEGMPGRVPPQKK